VILIKWDFMQLEWYADKSSGASNPYLILFS
jgi:hypothetical protein